MPLEEINQIFGCQDEALSARDEAEAAAILFAQHYAERREEFDPVAMEDLRRYYTQAQATEILAYLRAITLGNLTGNTLDALLARLHRPAPRRPTTRFMTGARSGATSERVEAEMGPRTSSCRRPFPTRDGRSTREAAVGLA